MRKSQLSRARETVATILERTSKVTIKDWFEHIRKDDPLTAITLTYGQRTCHFNCTRRQHTVAPSK
jgi:hypothetical protein